MSVDIKRVLVAEDNPGLSRVLALKLRQAGFDVTECRDGALAWQAMKHADFAAIVTDYEMPNMTGAELCREMRKLPEHTETPAIMVTAREMELDIKQLQAELNIAAVFAKPYSPKTVVRTLDRLLDSAVNEPRDG